MDWDCNINSLPLVYTTRLDEMAVFRQDLTKITPQYVVDSIIFESKPPYDPRVMKPQYSTKLCGTTRLKMKKTIRKPHHIQKQLKLKLSFDELNLKIEEIKKMYKRFYEVELQSESGTNNNTNSLSKLNLQLAMCKPLKIILEDISKTILKEKREKEIITISSDSDDVKICEFSPGIRIITEEPAPNHIIKNIKDFKNILQKNLIDCIVVFYNIYCKEFDAYQINDQYEVTECKTMKYGEVNKIQMKMCKSVYNIIVCCWKNRQCYVACLMDHKIYKNIARIVYRSHSCGSRCKCCCFHDKQYSKFDVNYGINMTENDTLRGNHCVSVIKRSNLISKALEFKKPMKWNGHPLILGNYDASKRVNKQSMRLLQLCNINGDVEFYEMQGIKNIIYSKYINRSKKFMCWLAATVGLSHIISTYNFTNEIVREKEIVAIRKKQQIFSFNTECFLRKPMTLSKEVPINSKKMDYSFLDSTYTIAHNKSFMRSRKESKVLSILPNVRNGNFIIAITKPAVTQYEVSQAGSASNTKEPSIRKKPGVSKLVQTQAVNSMIRDILHRFRNVLLTINSDGKVAAALNAPLTSLNSCELEILSGILSRAQSQVDKLGLTPGMSLKAGGPELVDANTSCVTKNSNNTTAPRTNSKNETTESNGRVECDIKIKFLQTFSKIVCRKKTYYEKSLRSFLGDTIESIPKITSVFSLNCSNYSLSDNIEDPEINRLPITTILVDDDSNISTIDDDSNANTETDSKMSMDTCLTEYKELNILEKEIALKPRKRKTLVQGDSNPAKLKHITETVSDDKDSLDTLTESPELITESDPSSIMTLTPTDKLDLNKASDNVLLRTLLTSKPKKMQF